MQPNPPFQTPPARAQTNGWGVAGFVVSLVGFLGSCLGGAILCPLGLIFSIIGVRREPRGLAIAGIVLGALGSVWAVVAMLIFGTLTAGCLGLAMSQVPNIIAINEASQGVQKYYKEKGQLPASLDEVAAAVPGTPTKGKDGTAIVYTVDDAHSFTLRLPGPDGAMNTKDDIVTRGDVGKQ